MERHGVSGGGILKSREAVLKRSPTNLVSPVPMLKILQDSVHSEPRRRSRPRNQMVGQISEWLQETRWLAKLENGFMNACVDRHT
jgi:hypothetical protein